LIYALGADLFLTRINGMTVDPSIDGIRYTIEGVIVVAAGPAAIYCRKIFQS